MSVVTKRVRSVPFEAVVTLCVCHITAKKPSNISVQPHGRRKNKLSGLQSLSALLQRLLSCLWAFSGLLRLTREFPGFIAHGSARENNFPDKKKKKKISAVGTWQFHAGSLLQSLRGIAWKRERVNQILPNPVSQGWHPAWRVPTPKPVPEQDRSCHPVLL